MYKSCDLRQNLLGELHLLSRASRQVRIVWSSWNSTISRQNIYLQCLPVTSSEIFYRQNRIGNCEAPSDDTGLWKVASGVDEMIKGRKNHACIVEHYSSLGISNLKLTSTFTFYCQHASQSIISISSWCTFESININYFTIARRNFSDWVPRTTPPTPRTLEGPQAQ